MGGQRDQIHLVPVAGGFDPQPRMGWEQLNAEHVFELRWWTIAEILAATEATFFPADMGAQLATLVENGPPQTPIDVNA